MFFFERKNQKTFPRLQRAQTGKVFFASLFFRKKKTLPYAIPFAPLRVSAMQVFAKLAIIPLSFISVTRRKPRAMQRAGTIACDYGNNLRGEALTAGATDAFEIPGFIPEYIRPQFCTGRGPFRWVALSGDPADIAATDAAVLEAVPDDPSLRRWIELAQERVAFQGLPARICWLGYGERARVGLAFNELVRTGKVKAPIVIGRDHLDCGSVASPHRETEAMADGSDAIADWPILNALVNCAAGATWVSVHHGGGVGIGNSIHAGMVVVADGTERAARCLERVLTSDPGMDVIRHVDAGYDTARDFARKAGVAVPHDRR